MVEGLSSKLIHSHELQGNTSTSQCSEERDAGIRSPRWGRILPQWSVSLLLATLQLAATSAKPQDPTVVTRTVHLCGRFLSSCSSFSRFVSEEDHPPPAET